MMNLAQLEKNLASTDLNQFKTEPLKLLVKQIYKYQNFKTKIILEKINRINYTKGTVKLYTDNIKRYLNNGARAKNISSNIYEIVDELKAVHAPILTPSESERATVYKTKKQKLVTPPSPTPVKVEPPKYIEKIPPQYGIKCGDWIRLQPSKEMALGYIECYKVIGDGKPVELVAIDLEVLNDR